MSFVAPWFLVLLPLVLLPLLLRQRRGVELLPAARHGFAAGGRVRLGQALPRLPWRLGLGMVLLVLALARPQWGAAPPAGSAPHQLVIALDLSISMLARDALPSRIERARGVAEQLISAAPTAEIGLIAFAGRAYVLAVPSEDRALLRHYLPALRPEQVQVPGSNFAALIGAATTAFRPGAGRRTLVLLSDGEPDPTPWRQLLPRLRAGGIRVVAVGFGSAAGAPVPVNGRNLVDAGGGEVRSRLAVDVLREIARASDGAWLDAGDAGNLAARIEALPGATPAAATGGGGMAGVEPFGWFLGAAILLLLWSAIAEWPALPRLAPSASGRRPAGVAVSVLALLAIGAAPVARPPPEPDPLGAVKRIVVRLVATPRPAAGDYLELARATADYGETHRLHLHPLQIGALQDGLAAVSAGAALEPELRDWAPLRARLLRLLKPRRTADDPEAGDGAPSDDPAGGETADPNEAGFDPNGQPDSRQVGGSPRRSGEDEWRVPSLVKPAYVLEKLRAADRPGEMFRLLQLRDPLPPRRPAQAQTW